MMNRNKKKAYRKRGVTRKDKLALFPDAISSGYQYEYLRKVFTWARVFKAGILLVHDGEDAAKILFVKQKSTTAILQDKKVLVPSRFGLPKGHAEAFDKSALDTAKRELREETGVDIDDPRLGARVLTTPIIYRRPEYDIEELTIYFIAVVQHKPEVHFCPKELEGAEWFEIKREIKTLDGLSVPTKGIIAAVGEIDWRKILTRHEKQVDIVGIFSDNKSEQEAQPSLESHSSPEEREEEPERT
ncbi:NUDIX hydrolase [Balamuthia mandrillaris]